MTNTIDGNCPLVKEEASAVFTVAFTDDTGAAVTPTAATWTLSDLAGNIIASKEDVAITPLATSATIAVSGPDLAIGEYGRHRAFLVEFTYDSTAGNGLLGKKEFRFAIRDLVKVP